MTYQEFLQLPIQIQIEAIQQYGNSQFSNGVDFEYSFTHNKEPKQYDAEDFIEWLNNSKYAHQPKYKVGDTLIYAGYLYENPAEFEFKVALIEWDDRFHNYIYYGVDCDDSCREDEVVLVK